ncbi:MAG: hypothetical protein ACRDRG_11190 [Pseudonocardiaceae bacterium]
MPMLTPTRSAVVYAITSVILGPVLVLLGYGLFTQGGGDFCDAIYALPDGSFDSVTRDREFRQAHVFQVVGASMMLLIGAGILTTLARHRSAATRSWNLATATVTVVMMLGYVAVISQSKGIFQTTC